MCYLIANKTVIVITSIVSPRYIYIYIYIYSDSVKFWNSWDLNPGHSDCYHYNQMLSYWSQVEEEHFIDKCLATCGCIIANFTAGVKCI